jgi:hypothetical protein
VSGSRRIGSSKAHFLPFDVHDVDSRGEIRDLDGRPGPVSGSLSTVNYYPFFALMMLLTAIAFVPVAIWYTEETYIQDEEQEGEATTS